MDLGVLVFKIVPEKPKPETGSKDNPHSAVRWNWRRGLGKTWPKVASLLITYRK